MFQINNSDDKGNFLFYISFVQIQNLQSPKLWLIYLSSIYKTYLLFGFIFGKNLCPQKGVMPNLPLSSREHVYGYIMYAYTYTCIK